MKNIIFFLPLLLTLTACGSVSEENSTAVTSQGVSTVNTTQVSSGSVNLTETGSITQSGGEILPQNIENPTVYSDISVDSINKIDSLDTLKKVNPMLADLPGSNHPQYVELQKASMMMGLLMTKLNSPELTQLLKEQSEILQGKPVWTPELIQVHELLDNAQKNPPKTPEELEVFKNALSKNTELSSKFQLTEEYKAYIKENQKKLTDINDAITKLYTPEMTALMEKIQKLSAEVSSNSLSTKETN